MDWVGPGTEVLLNPRLTAADRHQVERLIAGCPPLVAHVWLTTSGSTGRLKPVALAKTAILTAADAVNAHIGATSDDVWCRPLPEFHVGGLGIHARAFRTGSPVVVLPKWDPAEFAFLVDAQGVTLTSLVPAQVRDLVHEGLVPPPRLRVILLGGGATPDDLWREARALGWPLLPNYGMTETSAMMAVASPTDRESAAPPRLHVLRHINARVTDEGFLAFKGPSLFTGYATERGLDDPKQDGWWTSGDLGALDGDVLTVAGRADDVIKIGGESVALSALQARVESLRRHIPDVADAAIAARRDARLGYVIVLAVAGSREGAETLRQRYDADVLPFERARDVVRLDAIPRTPLGKIRRTALTDAVR